MTHDEADLHRRWAYLRAFQDRFPEALASAHRAAQLFAALGDRHAFGRALLARGSVLLMMDDTRTIPVLARSLSYLDSTQSRHCLPALYNLTYAFSLFHDLSPEDLERTLDLVTEARLSLRSRQRRPAARNLAGHRRVTPPDALFRYLQGRLLVLLKAHDRARPLLETAREDLLALGMLRDVATVSVELAECHFWLAGRYRWHRVSVLCAEVLGELSAAAVPSDILAAYRLLQASARARSAELLREGLREARSLLTRPT